MADGLRASLNPQEELTLRRVAHAAPTVDPGSIRRLLALALVEPIRGGWRLTATGKLRHEALPKATLAKGGPSTWMTVMFIDGLLEKATAMARAQGFAMMSDAAAATGATSGAAAVQADSVSTPRRREPTRAPLLGLTLFELTEWRARAKRRLEQSRLALLEQRRSHALQVAESARCIELSRSVLKASVPCWPARWHAGSGTTC